jgi:hypothetical protein
MRAMQLNLQKVLIYGDFLVSPPNRPPLSGNCLAKRGKQVISHGAGGQSIQIAVEIEIALQHQKNMGEN